MNLEKNGIEKRVVLSTLWLFVILNIVFRDIHQLFNPQFLDEMISGVVNGNELTEMLMFQAGFGVATLLLMVPLSRLLPPVWNRRIHMVMTPLAMIVIVTSIANPDLDDYFFTVVELITLVIIWWQAWRWQPEAAEPVGLVGTRRVTPNPTGRGEPLTQIKTGEAA